MEWISPSQHQLWHIDCTILILYTIQLFLVWIHLLLIFSFVSKVLCSLQLPESPPTCLKLFSLLYAVPCNTSFTTNFSGFYCILRQLSNVSMLSHHQLVRNCFPFYMLSWRAVFCCNQSHPIRLYKAVTHERRSNCFLNLQEVHFLLTFNLSIFMTRWRSDV